IDLRLLAASAGSAACRVVDSPSGTPNALSCHASVAHEIPHDAVVQGLEVSRGDVLQHQLFKTQFTDQTLQLAVLLLEFLQPSSLIHLQATVFLAPTVVALFCDSGILASQRRRLPICYGYLDLTEQIHNLIRLVLLSSSHTLSLSSLSQLHWHNSSRALHPLNCHRTRVQVSIAVLLYKWSRHFTPCIRQHPLKRSPHIVNRSDRSNPESKISGSVLI